MASIKQVKDGITQSEEVIDLPIANEVGEPYPDGSDGKPATIGVVGKDSKHYRRESLKFQREVSRLPKVEQEKVDWRRGLAACGVVRWSGWDDDHGKPWPCEREHVKALLAADHILEQVESGIKDHARFFLTRSTN